MKLNWQRVWLCYTRYLLLAVFLAFGFDHSSGAVQPSNPRPNFLLIRAHDMGFSDLGCYGG